ncbi:hypothetical protein IA57_07500 [Mangrovimonas yunxiaonensis]|uniref:Glycosyl transferase family 1 domain-containing protein n=1 Tax=Mangrovimonas yunxiaonensis TaxID=1197477 RepID=A0A084TLS8_9FLAO|nr:hypothetical protein [Mangrovimonas yunxiaonensis]KFB01664.1 hypothetical protein IA57_07500 [Mangrovimonas yunxiaonensis]GGH35348.1 hypothetical protein GCM10011364_01840 [Mangrovimonas yunxiaonensis]
MLKDKNRFVFLAPLSAISRRTRLYKISNYIHQNNRQLDIVHIGWERNIGERDEIYLDYDIEKKIILKGGGYGGSKIKLFYFLWIIKSFYTCLKLKKTDVVWALGFESAFPALLASKFKSFQVIFDDADRFSMLFPFPKPIKLIIEFFEKITSRNVYKHIIPVIERYNFKSDNFYILQNFPSKSEILEAKKIYNKTTYVKDKLVVNVNGWLGENRGIDIVKKLCDEKIEGLSFIMAGKLDCNDAKTIVNYPNVQYLGEVANAEALASYYASDFVFTYYKPNSKINTLAASNKWGDAIMTNIGVILNEEVLTGKFLIDYKIAFSFRTDNESGLIQILKDCIYNRSLIDNIKDKSREASREFGYFEDQLECLLNKTKVFNG